MHRIGVRFADESPLGECQTIDDLQFAMGKVWMGMDWGWVTIEERDNGLLIQHRCPPLTAAFGAGAASWTPAFLQGVYQRWFDLVGATNNLKVTQASEPDLAGCVDFRLGR